MGMCNCMGLTRTFSELEGMGKSVPPSKHHPLCEDYALRAYSKIHLANGGSSLILIPDQVAEFIRQEVDAGASEKDYEVTEIRLTQDQFENLPEFSGF